MSSTIKRVGVIGTGTIGASWTALFLAKGLQVLVSDPGPQAEEKLKEYLEKAWPTLEKLGLANGASLENYRFVGPSLEKYYNVVDFIQEVSSIRNVRMSMSSVVRPRSVQGGSTICAGYMPISPGEI